MSNIENQIDLKLAELFEAETNINMASCNDLIELTILNNTNLRGTIFMHFKDSDIYVRLSDYQYLLNDSDNVCFGVLA